MTVETAAEYTELIDGEEFVESQGTGGDFNPTFKFAEGKESSFVGVYKGTEEKDIKGKNRVLHTFEIEGEDFTVWGAAILDDRLKPVEVGKTCKVIKTGKQLTSASGNRPWEFKVLVSKRAIAA